VDRADPDLLLQRHFEGALSSYDEQRLSNLILRGGAFSDRFVEWRELERGLAEALGGRVKAIRPVLVSDRCREETPEWRSPVFRARRFPPASCDVVPDGCAGEILSAYTRRLRILDTARHRDALGHCLGLIVEDLRDLLRVRYRSGMTSHEIAGLLGRPAAETEALFCRIKNFLAGCVRLRLSRRA